jgi:hypothetical protein
VTEPDQLAFMQRIEAKLDRIQATADQQGQLLVAMRSRVLPADPVKVREPWRMFLAGFGAAVILIGAGGVVGAIMELATRP